MSLEGGESSAFRSGVLRKADANAAPTSVPAKGSGASREAVWCCARTNSVLLRSPAMIVRQHELFTVAAIFSFAEELLPAQHGFDECIFMGHEATTMGTPIVESAKKTLKTSAEMRYFFVRFIVYM
jgi:hypothetical protein